MPYPQSIMPLQLLVPSLNRVSCASTSHPLLHPLHGLLERLLLTPRACSAKYQVELSQILSDGGGAGEIEETVMWYALNNEKRDAEDERARPAGVTHDDGPWVDEKWKRKWLARMEKRE